MRWPFGCCSEGRSGCLGRLCRDRNEPVGRDRVRRPVLAKGSGSYGPRPRRLASRRCGRPRRCAAPLTEGEASSSCRRRSCSRTGRATSTGSPTSRRGSPCPSFQFAQGRLVWCGVRVTVSRMEWRTSSVATFIRAMLRQTCIATFRSMR